MIVISVYVIFIILGLTFRKSKIVTLALLIYSWCLIGLNSYTPDYESYYQVFNGTYYGKNIEIGYHLINTFFYGIGLSFQQFRMIWALIYTVLLANFVIKETNNPNCALSLMLICPFLLDVSGIRSCVAYLLVMNFSLLLKKDGLKNRILFCIGVLIASTIHISSLFFLTFLLESRALSKNKKAVILGFITLIAFVIRTPIFTKICELVYDLTGIYAVQKWFLGGSSNTHPNIIGFLSVAIFLVMLEVLASFETKFILNNNDEDSCRNVTFLGVQSFHMLYLLPVIMITIESQRMMYGSLVMFHCITSNCFSEKDSCSKFSLSAGLYVLAEIVILLAMMWMYSYSYKSHDVFSALRNNYFLTDILPLNILRR